MLHMKQGQRPGIVLLVVMVMLALFAVVAISFVFYAESQATAEKYVRDAQFQFQADAEPELLFNFFLGAQLYDSDDNLLYPTGTTDPTRI